MRLTGSNGCESKSACSKRWRAARARKGLTTRRMEVTKTNKTRTSRKRTSRTSNDKSNPNAALLKSLQAMDQKMQSVEYKFISRAEALSDDKYYSASDKIYLNLIWLNAEVGAGGGDVAGGVGYGPTDTAMTLLQMLEKDLTAAESDVQSLLDKDVPEFNRALLQRRITPITAANSATQSPQ